MGEPISTFRRTATSDTTLRGVDIKPADWISIMSGSANRDVRVSTSPNTFDLTLNPKPPCGLRRPGPHYCLGAFPAKTQLVALHRELIFRASTLRVADPSYMTSNFIRAVKSMRDTLN